MSFKGCDTADLVSFNACRHDNDSKLAPNKKYTKGYFKGPIFAHSEVCIFHPGPNGAASHDLLPIKLYRPSAYLASLLTASFRGRNKHLTGGVAINLGEVSVRY